MGSGWHTGHFIPSYSCGLFLRYDLRNLHSSCYNCNINLGGNSYLYGMALGSEVVQELYALKNKTVKWAKEDYEEKIAEYTALLKA